MGNWIWVLLGFIGLGVGTLSALIGASGGFLLVPILLFLYPKETPAVITSISLSLSFFSASSSMIAYSRLRRIDFRSGILFTLASGPGAVLGATITRFLSRETFQAIFGVILLVVAIYIAFRPKKTSLSRPHLHVYGLCSRTITDSGHNVFSYSYNLPLGIAVAFGVGLTSGLLGIGGGIIHVPCLSQLLGFPTHIATATSSFVMTITTSSALTLHILSGVFTQGFRRALVLSFTAIIGAQFGARLSRKVSGMTISRLIAGSMAIVALRMLAAAFLPA